MKPVGDMWELLPSHDNNNTSIMDSLLGMLLNYPDVIGDDHSITGFTQFVRYPSGSAFRILSGRTKIISSVYG